MWEVSWDDLETTEVLTSDQQVIAEIAADDGIDTAEEVVGTNVHCGCPFYLQVKPRSIDKRWTLEFVDKQILLLCNAIREQRDGHTGIRRSLYAYSWPAHLR